MLESVDYTLVDLESEDGADWCCKNIRDASKTRVRSARGLQFTQFELIPTPKRISNAQLGWELTGRSALGNREAHGRIVGRKYGTSHKRPEGKNAESICLLLKSAGFDWSGVLEVIHVTSRQLSSGIARSQFLPSLPAVVVVVHVAAVV
jgi:hypothetical protein